MRIPTDYHMIARDYGRLGWGSAGDMPLTREDAKEVILEAFKDDDVGADLTTLVVWHMAADVPPRNITEDLLREIGAALAKTCDAETYPNAFRKWADPAMISAWESQYWAETQWERRA